MPQDDHRSSEIARIRSNLERFKKSPNGTVYASLYVADVGFLLGLLPAEPTPKPVAPPAPPTELEVSLEHDKAGRVERNPDRS